MPVSGKMAIASLGKELGAKVGWLMKNSGNSLSDGHKNFSNCPIKSWENWVQSWQPYKIN